MAAPAPAWAGFLPTPPPADSSSGKVGTHGWAEDTEASPAGRCLYGVTVGTEYRNHLARIGTAAPVVFARGNRSSQRVAMRLLAQRWESGPGTWVLAKRSDWFFKMATPDTAAMFKQRSVALDDAFESTNTHRVKVQLRWFARDGVTPVGNATIWPDWYRAREGAATHVQDDWCGGTTG